MFTLHTIFTLHFYITYLHYIYITMTIHLHYIYTMCICIHSTFIRIIAWCKQPRVFKAYIHIRKCSSALSSYDPVEFEAGKMGVGTTCALASSALPAQLGVAVLVNDYAPELRSAQSWIIIYSPLNPEP